MRTLEEVVEEFKIKVYTKEEIKKIIRDVYDEGFNLSEILKIEEEISYYIIYNLEESKELGEEKVLNSIKERLTQKLLEFSEEKDKEYNNNGYDRAIWMALLISVKLNYINVFKYILSIIKLEDVMMDEGIYLSYALEFEHFEIAKIIIENTPSDYSNRKSYSLSETLISRAEESENDEIKLMMKRKYDWYS